MNMGRRYAQFLPSVRCCDRRSSGNDVFRVNQGPVAMHAGGGTPRAKRASATASSAADHWATSESKPASQHLVPLTDILPKALDVPRSKSQIFHLAPLYAPKVIDSLYAHGSAMLLGKQGSDEPTSRDADYGWRVGPPGQWVPFRVPPARA